jgi:tRNA-splicing ligase RtcB
VWTPGGPAGIAEADKARTQVGTLGGGNHFIELQAGSDGSAYVMIHSGSRNVGFRVADHYNKLAKGLNDRWRVSVPAEWDLAFLPLDTDEGAAYVSEMTACVEFARLNRSAMMDAVLRAVSEAWDVEVVDTERLDIAHNYAALEHHSGKNVMVHRKGATRAREGELGIIPGSQGTRSYIVRGKGNPLSYMSCSHGAGRAMGRKDAERRLDLADEQRKLDEAGVLHAVRGKGDLDEAPGAYKDISVVMAAQTDLVDVVTELRPLAVVKG